MSEATQSPTSSTPAAGWYPDPQGQGLRWWDGSAWTEHTHEETPAAGGSPAASTGASPASTTPAAASATGASSSAAPSGKKRVNFVNEHALAILIALLVVLAVVVVLQVI